MSLLTLFQLALAARMCTLQGGPATGSHIQLTGARSPVAPFTTFKGKGLPKWTGQDACVLQMSMLLARQLFTRPVLHFHASRPEFAVLLHPAAPSTLSDRCTGH